MTVFYTRLAKYYDSMYSFKDYKSEAKRVHKLIQHYKTSEGNCLLDAACGTGGHIEYLRDHYETTGFDLSKEMLTIARKKCKDVQFIQGNMTSMDLDQQFDIIVCLFGSISYLTTVQELTRAIRSFSKHTKPGGVVLIEPVFTEETFRSRHRGILCVNQKDVKIARVNANSREGNVVYLNFHFLIATNEGIEHFIDPSPMGVFAREVFRGIMEDCGFSVDFVEPGLSKEGLFIGVKQ